MPRIPQILAREGVATPAGPRMPLGGTDLAGPILNAGNAVAQTLFTFADIERRQRVAGVAVEVDGELNQFKRDYNAEEQRLKEQGEPATYADTAETAFDAMAEERAAKLKYPESRGLWQKKVDALKTDATIRTRAEGIRLQNAQTNAGAQIADREDTSAAVFGATPEARDDALKSLANRDRILVAQGVRTATALPQHLADIDKATARRDFDDPSKRAQVIADLTAGQYRYASAEDQLQLRDALVTKAHSDKETERKEEALIRQETADEAERSIVDLVRTKDYTQANSMLSRYGQYMKGEEKRTWSNFIDKARESRPDNPEVRMALSVTVNTADTKDAIASARAKVIDAVGRGLLSVETGDKYLGHLQSMGVADRNRREDKGLDAYHRSRSEIKDLVKEDLRVTGPLQQLVPSAQNAYSMALEDLNRNVPVEGPGKEEPRAWYNRTRAEWIARVDAAATARISELERGIDPQAVRQELERYRSTGQRPPRDVFDKIRRLLDADTIREEQTILSGKPKPAEGEKKPDQKGKKLGYE